MSQLSSFSTEFNPLNREGTLLKHMQNVNCFEGTLLIATPHLPTASGTSARPQASARPSDASATTSTAPAGRLSSRLARAAKLRKESAPCPSVRLMRTKLSQHCHPLQT